MLNVLKVVVKPEGDVVHRFVMYGIEDPVVQDWLQAQRDAVA